MLHDLEPPKSDELHDEKGNLEVDLVDAVYFGCRKVCV